MLLADIVLAFFTGADVIDGFNGYYRYDAITFQAGMRRFHDRDGDIFRPLRADKNFA